MFRIADRAGFWPVAPLGVGLVLTSLVAGAQTARADRIMLRGGGQIHGKLITDPKNPQHLTFVGEVGKNPIVYRPAQILQVIPEKSILDEYVALRSRDRTLAEEEFQLGSWCEDHKLTDLASNHFEAAVRLDPNYGPAHEKLGHALIDGRWLNADEQREAQGMIKYRGRWITAEEKERIDGETAQVVENQSWLRRIKLYRDAYVTGQDSRAKDAERRLLAIREVAAVGPIARILGDDPNPTIRDLAGRVLGAITGPEASSALVNRLLAETDGNVRESLITEIARRDADEVVPRLVRALKAPQPEIINRAAWGLNRLNAVTAVPQLIAVLNSVEQRTEMVPINPGGGGGNGGLNASFNSVAPGGINPAFGNYTSSAYVVPTPAVVAPGAVAFGAVGVPLVNGVALGGGGGGLSLGGGTNEVKYLPRIVAIDHPNVEVRSALTRLTGQDFGFDSATWKRWASSSFRSDRTPARRVVSP